MSAEQASAGTRVLSASTTKQLRAKVMIVYDSYDHFRGNERGHYDHDADLNVSIIWGQLREA